MEGGNAVEEGGLWGSASERWVGFWLVLLVIVGGWIIGLESRLVGRLVVGSLIGSVVWARLSAEVGVEIESGIRV